jgi:ribonucleotide monophosphatase NagD (HAD superfamily)
MAVWFHAALCKQVLPQACPDSLLHLSMRRTLCHSAALVLTAVSIDGVLLRSSDALPRAHKTLAYLQSQRIPFVLLTNGGGKHESERVAELSSKLDVAIDTSIFIQSHTPFADMVEYKDKNVLIVGGEGDNCRKVAEAYG